MFSRLSSTPVDKIHLNWSLTQSARPSPLPSYSQSLSPLKMLPSLPVETSRMDRLSTVER